VDFKEIDGPSYCVDIYTYQTVISLLDITNKLNTQTK